MMNGLRSKKLLFVLGPVTGLVMFGAVLLVATFLTNREYREPDRVPVTAVDQTPRATGLPLRGRARDEPPAGWATMARA